MQNPEACMHITDSYKIGAYLSMLYKVFYYIFMV